MQEGYSHGPVLICMFWSTELRSRIPTMCPVQGSFSTGGSRGSPSTPITHCILEWWSFQKIPPATYVTSIFFTGSDVVPQPASCPLYPHLQLSHWLPDLVLCVFSSFPTYILSKFVKTVAHTKKGLQSFPIPYVQYVATKTISGQRNGSGDWVGGRLKSFFYAYHSHDPNQAQCLWELRTRWNSCVTVTQDIGWGP